MSASNIHKPCPCPDKSKSKTSLSLMNHIASGHECFLHKRELFDETLKKEVFVEAAQCQTEAEFFRRKVFNLDKINCHHHRSREMCEFIERSAATSIEYINWLNSVIDEAKRLRDIHRKYLMGMSDTNEKLTVEMWYQFSKNFLSRESLYATIFEALCLRSIVYEKDVTRSLCLVWNRDDSLECKDTDEEKSEEEDLQGDRKVRCFQFCKSWCGANKDLWL